MTFRIADHELISFLYFLQLFETEINRKVKHAPALNIDEVKAPFPLQVTTTGEEEGAEEDANVIPGDAVSDMWSFGNCVE
jgi:hypothetical protein